MTVALVIPVPAAALEKGPPPKYCSHSTVRDYRAPLRNLPALRGAPELRGLPFGPQGVTLSEPLDLREHGGFVGYAIRVRRSREALLDWDLTATLTRIDPQGNTHGKARRSHAHLGSLAGKRRIGFRISPAPALYKIELAVNNASGKTLGEYGEYLRVVKPALDVRISLNATSLRSGETVAAQVENHGTGIVILSPRYSIEVHDGSAWALAPISPLTPDPLVGLLAAPGGAVTCWSFTIPTAAPPGRYRLAGAVEHSWDWPGSHPTSIDLAAEFSILPPS